MAETLSTGDDGTTAQSWQEEGEGSKATPFTRRDQLLAWLPPLVLAILVAFWGVDLPYFDQWEMIPRFEQWSEGHFPWQAIWRLHNEHRLILPELIMLLVGKLTHWNILVELWINVGLAALLFLVWRRQLRQGLGSSAQFSPFLPCLSLVVFSPSQWGNWSWGWQIQIFLALLLVATAILLLSTWSRSPSAFLAALGCAALAPFSFANGLLLFPLALPLVLRERQGRTWRTVSWILSGVLVYYLYGVTRLLSRLESTSSVSPLTRWLAQGDYWLHYLAGPVFVRGPLAPAIAYGLVPLSLMVAGLMVARLGRGRLQEILPWLTLLAFGLASAAMTALGRYTFGIEQALSSRYFTIANFYWIGLLGLLLVYFQQQYPERLPWRVKIAGAAVLLLLLASAFAGASAFRQDSLRREWLRAVLRGEVETDQDVAKLLPFPDRQAVVERIETMKKLRISVYRK